MEDSMRREACAMVLYVLNNARTSRRTERYKSGLRLIAKTLRKYELARGITVMSSDFDYRMAEDYAYFLSHESGLAKNTVSGYLSDIYTQLNRANRDEYKTNPTYFDYRHGIEEVQAVYLTTEEIERISHLKIAKMSLQIIRDLFVVGCCTGMRYSDYSRLRIENIQDNVIKIRTIKTGSLVDVPMHRLVREIIERNRGEFPIYDGSSANFNHVIKNICKRAGITDKIVIERTVGGRWTRRTKKKYELVSSHTARRSFATNARLAGIEAERVLKMTGHKSTNALEKYIRLSPVKNAIDLSDHPFFK